MGVSARTFERIEAAGDGPAKTRLSEGRIGYRVSDLETWLDARRIGVAS
jgi:predicted DNA-binding transcriptional regulator AlpA